jgi:hypothetical protein
MSNRVKNTWSAEGHVELPALSENGEVTAAAGKSVRNLTSILKSIQDKIKGPVEYKTLGISADFDYPDSLYGTVELKQPPYSPGTVGEPACLCGCCCCFKSPQCCSCKGAVEKLKRSRWKALAGFAMQPNIFDMSVGTFRSRMLTAFNMVVTMTTLILCVFRIDRSGYYMGYPSCATAFNFEPRYTPRMKTLGPSAWDSYKKHYEQLCAAFDRTVFCRKRNANDTFRIKDDFIFTTSELLPIYHNVSEQPNGCPDHTLQAGVGSVTEKLFGLNSLPLRTVILRPIFVSIANSRLNRVYGWAGVGWVGAVLNCFSLIVWKAEDLRHCPRVSNVASAFREKRLAFPSRIESIKCRFNESKRRSAFASARVRKSDLIRAGFAYIPFKKEWVKPIIPRGTDYDPLGKYFESFTTFFSVLFGSWFADYVRAGVGAGQKLIPRFDSAQKKTPYELVNRRFEDQYDFVELYGSMWVLFNWLLLLSCYIEVVLLGYVALKWANRRFERVRNLANLISQFVHDSKVRASIWSPLQTQNNNGKARKSTRLKPFRVPVRVIIAILTALGMLSWSVGSVHLFNANKMAWWMSVKERYVSFYSKHAANLLLPKNETNVMGEAMSRLNEEKDDAMETVVNLQNTILGINDSLVVEQMKKCMQMNAGLTTEVFEIRKSIVENYNKAFLGKIEALSADTNVADIAGLRAFATEVDENSTRACNEGMENALNESRTCVERALKNSSVSSAEYLASLASSSCSGTADMMKSLALAKLSKGSTKEIVIAKFSSALFDSMSSVNLPSLGENKAWIKSAIAFGLVSLWDFVQPHSPVSIAKMNQFVESVFDGLIQMYRTGIVLGYISAFVVLGQVVKFFFSLNRLGHNQYAMVKKYFVYPGGYEKALSNDEISFIDFTQLIGKEKLSMNTAHMSASERRDYFTQRLRYRRLMQAPQFVGSFVFCVSFGFFALYFSCVGCIAIFFQSLLYTTIGNNTNEIITFAYPFVFLFVTRGLGTYCAKSRLRMRHKQTQAGPSHIRAANSCDFINTVISAFLGPFPALGRIALSLGMSILYIPRLDVQLPGHFFDRTVHQYEGLLNEMRLKAEFQVKRRLEILANMAGSG